MDPVAQQQTGTSSNPQDLTPEEEGLQLLEWPAVCAQVASFCGTSMAAELLQGGGLPLGASQADSEVLLQQTAEALEAGLKVAGGCSGGRQVWKAHAPSSCCTMHSCGNSAC
jgi:DNA mismatch repair protein MutS2